MITWILMIMISLNANTSVPVKNQTYEIKQQNTIEEYVDQHEEYVDQHEDVSFIEHHRQGKQILLNMLIENTEAQQNEDMIHRLRAYMIGHNFIQPLIDLAPLMVQLANEYNQDPRMFAVTVTAESSGGRANCGRHNPIGALGMNFPSWEASLRYYYRRIGEYGFGNNSWRIAWYWYGGGSSMGGRAESYANNIINSVNRI